MKNNMILKLIISFAMVLWLAMLPVCIVYGGNYARDYDIDEQIIPDEYAGEKLFFGIGQDEKDTLIVLSKYVTTIDGKGGAEQYGDSAGNYFSYPDDAFEMHLYIEREEVCADYFEDVRTRGTIGNYIFDESGRTLQFHRIKEKCIFATDKRVAELKEYYAPGTEDADYYSGQCTVSDIDGKYVAYARTAYDRGEIKGKYFAVLDEEVVPGLQCILLVEFGDYSGSGKYADMVENKLIYEMIRQPFYYSGDDTGVRTNITKTTDASDIIGEIKSIEIPQWVFVTPGFVVGGLVLGGIAKGSKKKKSKQSQKKQEQPQEPQGILELRINKNFGNTIRAGDDPVKVGARIVEVFPQGEKARPDLTSMIRISSADGYLTVNPAGMDDTYQNAWVSASADAPQIPQQAAVAFTVNAPGAVFTNRVVFNIEGQKISFFQENLTLPAVYDKVVRLPFMAEGIPQDVQFGAEIDGDAYKLMGIENGDRQGLYYAVLSERLKTKDKAGKYETYDLTVTAYIPSQSSPAGVRQVSGTISVIRYHMGLAVYMPGYIGCYLEKFDPRRHGTYRDLIFKNETDGTEYSPAVTDVSVSMITWDEESHKILRGRPKFEDNLFTIEPLDEADDAKTTDFMSRATWQKTDAEIIQMVGIYPECYKICDDASYLFKLRPSGLIDAPARRKVKFKIKAVFRGETYEFEKKVWLFSQKPRDCGAAEMEELRKKDRQITRDLRYIVETINGHGLYERLGAVYRVAKMMLDGFEERFGYDVNLYYVVKAYFNRVCRGISVGANVKPEDMAEYPPDKGFVCDVMQALHDSYDTHEKALESWAMILPRMGLAGLTFGVSEGVFSSMKVCHDMIDTYNATGSEWDAFIAGVKEPLFNYAGEKLMQAGMNTYAKGSRGGYKDTMKQFGTELNDAVFGEAARQMGAISDGVENAIKNLKNCAPEYHGNRTMESLNTMRSTEKAVAREADGYYSQPFYLNNYSTEAFRGFFFCMEKCTYIGGYIC